MKTMNMPNFSAEASLYKTNVYYHHLSNGSMQANKGVIQSSLQCSTCYLDDTGACVKDCINCITKPGFPPICGEDVIVNCRPNQCSQCGPCNCTTTCTKDCGGTILPC
jgi:hypothetical protein